jgi:hypothetical protein
MDFVELRTAFFLIILLSVSSAGSILDDAPAALGVITIIVIVLLAIAYMLAETINNQQLLAWVKQEMRELIVAIILFVAVFALFNGDKPLISSLTGTNDYKAAAEGVIDDMIGRANVAYNDLIDAYHVVGMRSGYSTNVMAGYYLWVSAGGMPSSGYSSFMIFFNQAAGGLANMIFLYQGVRTLLDFFLAVGGQLMYLAFILRVIPFTRQLGSTLVALVIGAYIIFPFALFMMGPFHDLITMPAPNLPHSAIKNLEFYIPSGASFICGEWYVRLLVGMFGEIGFALPPCLLVAIATWGAGFQPCWEILTKIVYPIIMQILLPIVWGLTIGISTFVVPDIGEDFDHFVPFLHDINNLVVVSYIDAILISIITIAGVKSISVALGGEYMLPGIQRLV